MRHLKGSLVLLLIVAALAGLGGYAYHVVSKLLVIRVATGPAGSFGADLSTSLVHLIALDRPRLRVNIQQYANDSEAVKALLDGKADVAIARADAGPTPGLSVAVVRHDLGFFVLPHTAKADSISGLRGETIGIVGTSENDMALFEIVRDTYGLPATPAPVALAVGDVAEALKSRKVQALFLVGAASGTTIAKTFAAVRAATNGQPKLIAVDEAEAIVKRNHRLETVDLPKGGLQGAPALPDDDFSTLGVSTRIFATANMPDEVAAELTRIILTDKPKVASLLPKTAIIEPPETDKLNASLPVHSGTAAYLTGNQESLSDEAQNLFYWFSIVGTVLASCVAALAALWRKIVPQRHEETLEMLDLWVAAREARDLAAVADTEKALDTLVQSVLRDQAAGKGDDIGAAFPLLVSQTRRTIDRRRAELSGQSPAPARSRVDA